MFAEERSMGHARIFRTLSLGTPLLLSLALGGCATSANNSLMDARAEAPMPSHMPPQAHTYLPVEDLPAPREKAALTLAEQTKIKKDLIASRDQQAIVAKAKNTAPIDFGKPETAPANDSPRSAN
jgi:hypothetical protein